jgi:bifunctional DNase/RNase
MSRMIEVVIDSVRVSLIKQERIVILREVNAERYLSIYIGPHEAEAITIALQEIEVARPQTHDLLKNVLNALGGRLVRVEVVALREDVYFGNLVVEHDSRMVNIDSRPSDALALAARAHAQIFIAREVMEAVGVVPEQDLGNQEPTAPAPSSSEIKKPEEPASSERLSVFEDFLSNLNLGDFPKPADEDDADSDDEEKPDSDQ